MTAVQAVSLSASQIIGGLMRATNGAMEIDFNNSAIDMFKDGAIRFHSGSNAIYRQSTDGIHTAFVHFDTTSKGGYMLLLVRHHQGMVLTVSLQVVLPVSEWLGPLSVQILMLRRRMLLNCTEIQFSSVMVSKAEVSRCIQL